MAPRAALAHRSLYLCTPDRPDLPAFVAACIEGGVDVIQLREKHLEARVLLERAGLVRELCVQANVPFIVNDRPDLALAARADGVHVGQDDVSPAICRRILGEEAIVGLSTHRPEELAAADIASVDYLAAGPVVWTPTHPERTPTGMGYVEAAAAFAARAGGEFGPLPLFVTGGVAPERVDGLAASGARGFVVVRYLTEAPDPKAAARSLRVAIDEALERHGTLDNPSN